MADSVSSQGGGTYAWYARTAPMYLALLPLAIAVGIWFPDAPALQRIGAAAGAPAILAVFLAEKGRDRGRRLQSKLWKSWGGPLLTQYLRHRNDEINEHLKLGYHQKLSELLPHLSIPSAEEEALDPTGADSVYDACAQHLVNIVREDTKRFWSAFKENRSQGFRRNLWGLKPLGVVCSSVAVVAAAAWLVSAWQGTQTLTAPWVVATLLCVGILGAWVFWVTPAFVRLPYDAYARRVLESLQKMGDQDCLVQPTNASGTVEESQ